MGKAGRLSLGHVGSPRVCSAAAKGGHVGASRWVRREMFIFSPKALALAAERGHLGFLGWIWTSGCCPLDECTCSRAAKGGQLEILEWAWADGCPWDERTCAESAGGGHLNVLRWARSNDCPWGKGVRAGKSIYLNVHWARTKCCDVSSDTVLIDNIDS